MKTSGSSRTTRETYGDFIASSPDGVRLVLDRSEESGFDEVVFIPLTDDLRELDELAKIVANR